MSKAADTLTTRRNLLAGFVALPAIATAPIALAASDHLDARLLELDAAHRIAAANAANRADDVSPDDFSDLCEVLRDIEFEIQDTPSHTLAGLAVKARIAVEYLPQQWGEKRMLDDILRVLVEDVQRLAGQAAA